MITSSFTHSCALTLTIPDFASILPEAQLGPIYRALEQRFQKLLAECDGDFDVAVDEVCTTWFKTLTEWDRGEIQALHRFVQGKIRCSEISAQLRALRAPVPAADVWRLVIDGRFQRESSDPAQLMWALDQNEQEFLLPMLDAFVAMLSNVNQSLTVTDIEQWHDIAVSAELDHDAGMLEEDCATRFGLCEQNMSPAGVYEFKARYPHNVQPNNAPRARLSQAIAGDPSDSKLELLLNPMLHEDYEMVAAGGTRAQKRQRCQALINAYALQTRHATSPELLSAIVGLAQDIEQHHFFADGNARTVAFLLVNKLLLQNNLGVWICPDPNHFDLMGRQELIDDLDAGLCAAQAIYSNVS